MMGGMMEGGGVSGSSSSGDAMMGGGEATMPGFEGTAGDSNSVSSSAADAVTPERGLNERMMRMMEEEGMEGVEVTEGGLAVPGVRETARRSVAEAYSSFSSSSSSASESASVAVDVVPTEQSVPVSREATLPIGHVHTFIGSKPIDASAAIPIPSSSSASSSFASAASASSAVAASLPRSSSRIGTVDVAAVTQPMEIGPDTLSAAGAVEEAMPGGTVAPNVGLDSSDVGGAAAAAVGLSGDAPASSLLLLPYSWDDVPYFLLALTPSGGECVDGWMGGWVGE